MTTPKPKGLPWPLILLAASFLVPAVIAWSLFFSGWRPGDTTNHGTIVQPPQRLEGALLTETGAAEDPDVLRGKWTILIVSGGDCARTCEERLLETRQTRLALAQHADRVHRVLLLPPGATPLSETQADAHPDLTVYRRGGHMLPDDAIPGEGAVHVSLLDTGGYRMLAYPEPLDAQGLLADMKKVLKISNLDLERLQSISEDNQKND